MNIDNLKYPIGKFTKQKNYAYQYLTNCILTIEQLPQKLNKAVENLTETELNTPYRPEGWTINQVVHHLADSHMNSFIRFKLALTEDNPTIKPYLEHLWANLPDSHRYSIKPSLQIIEGVHARWCVLLNSLTEEDLNKTVYHPENNTTYNLSTLIDLYAWHCNHHLAHINNLINNNFTF